MNSSPTHLSGVSPVQPADDGTCAKPFAPTLSPRLYSADLAPTKAAGRSWGRYSLFALWTNDVHNIANYSFAIGLFALGMSGAQILAAFDARLKNTPEQEVATALAQVETIALLRLKELLP